MRKYTDTKQKSYASGRRKINARKARPIQTVKMKLKKGDHVIVVSGKDKGKTGAIVRVIPRENRVVIDGVAVAKRSIGARRGTAAVGIVERPMPINASNVMLVDPEGKKPTRVGRRVEGAKMVRYAKKSSVGLK